MNAMSFKVILLGDSFVGKTSLLKRFQDDVFDELVEPTIGMAFCKRVVERKNLQITLEIWDTAGQEKFKMIAPIYFRNASAVILCYDASKSDTIKGAKEWLNSVALYLNQDCVKFLVANKIDLGNEQPPEEFLKDNSLIFIQTSAKTGENVHKLFRRVARILAKNKLRKMSNLDRQQIVTLQVQGPEIVKPNRCYIRIKKSADILTIPHPNKSINGYVVKKSIGEGAYGKIKLVEKDGQLYAMKKFKKYLLKKKNKIYRNPDGTTKYVSLLDEVYRELGVHLALNNQYIVQLHEILDDEKREKMYFIMEYAQRGQLLEWDGKKSIFVDKNQLTEEQITNIIKECLLALDYLHSNFVVHRDIKPHNILLDQEFHVKLCDFGQAQKLTGPDDRVKGTEGTFQFVAPECLREKKDGDKPGYNGYLADIWGLGVVLYCLIEKKLPFQNDVILELFKQIETKEINFTQKSPLVEIAKAMLIRDTALRPCAKDLLSMFYKL